MSYGVSTYDANSTSSIEELLDAADRELYAEKRRRQGATKARR